MKDRVGLRGAKLLEAAVVRCAVRVGDDRDTAVAQGHPRSAGALPYGWFQLSGHKSRFRVQPMRAGRRGITCGGTGLARYANSEHTFEELQVLDCT